MRDFWPKLLLAFALMCDGRGISLTLAAYAPMWVGHRFPELPSSRNRSWYRNYCSDSKSRNES